MRLGVEDVGERDGRSTPAASNGHHHRHGNHRCRRASISQLFFLSCRRSCWWKPTDRGSSRLESRPAISSHKHSSPLTGRWRLFLPLRLYPKGYSTNVNKNFFFKSKEKKKNHRHRKTLFRLTVDLPLFLFFSLSFLPLIYLALYIRTDSWLSQEFNLI